MGYTKASDVLPDDLLAAVQRYVDGEYLYIPRKEDNKKAWGEVSRSRQALIERNKAILRAYAEGCPVQELARMHYLSKKTVYKILAARTRI